MTCVLNYTTIIGLLMLCYNGVNNMSTFQLKMNDISQIDFYNEVTKESGSFEHRFNLVFHRKKLTSDVYLRLKSQTAELSILNGFRFTEEDPLIEYVSVEVLERFHDFDNSSAISIAKVQTNFKFDIEDILGNIARFSGEPIHLEDSVFNLLVDRWYCGLNSKDTELVLQNEYIGALDILYQRGYLNSFEWTPWTLIRNTMGPHIVLDALAFSQFKEMTYDQIVGHYRNASKEEAFLHYFSNCDLNVENDKKALIVDSKFRSKSTKYSFLYKAWKHQLKRGRHTEIDAQIIDLVLSSRYDVASDEYIVEAIKMGLGKFNPFTHFSMKTIDILKYHFPLAEAIESYLSIEHYSQKELGQLLINNRYHNDVATDGNTLFSDDLIQKMFDRSLVYAARYAETGTKNMLTGMLEWLPEVDKLDNDTLTPITLQCLAYLLLYEESFLAMLDEKQMAQMGSVLPGANSEVGRLKLKETFFPDFDSIELIEDLYDTAGLIQMLISSSKKDEFMEVSLPMID